VNVLEITQLKKSFGKQTVINGLSLSVPEHSVFGFVGQNGSGKTTTMKMVLGLLKPDSGNIRICGEPVKYGETKTNRYVGYLPDVPEFYNYMKPLEYLKLCGEISGLSKEKISDQSNELLSLVGLDGMNKRIGGFSRGMKQRLGIAQALIGEPQLLICDEPTSALDPIGRKEILDILATVKGKTTVIFSTHILSDVERICDYISILNNGKLALNGSLSDVKSQHRSNGFEITFADIESAVSFKKYVTPIAVDTMRSGTSVTVKLGNENHDGFVLIDLLAKRHLAPLKFEIAEPTLENLFLEAVQ
jgi:ABC-2 type transport system ATP-binding protein